VNSISAVVTTDFIQRFRPKVDKESMLTAKLVAVSVGVIVIFGSSLIEHVPGNLLAVSKRATDLLVTPLFTLFFFALFVRFSTAAGANTGAICGFLSAALIAFWNPLFDQENSLSFTWISPVALTVGITVGCIVSRLTYRKTASASPELEFKDE